MHIQRTSNSCGPDCVYAICQRLNLPISQAQVDAAFGCPDINDFSNLLDSPAHHEVAFKRLGLAYRVVTCGEILNGGLAEGTVEVLLHAQDDPKTILPESTLNQHWAVVEAVNTQTREVFLDMGRSDLLAGRFTFDSIQARYAVGAPTATAYQILGFGRAAKPAWYSRLWVWVTGWFK